MGLLVSELAQIRTDAAAAACDKTCQIYRPTITHGTTAEAIPSYTLLSTTTAGMTQPSAGLLQNYDFLIGSLAAWQVKLPYGTDVQHRDRLVIDGETLEVQVVLIPRSYEALRTVIASEVK